MSFNFKDVEVPKDTLSYVKPGFWKLAPVKAELVEKEGKSPYITITFEGDKGKLVEKFYLSEKARVRLQYLHQGMFEGKRIEKEFKNENDVVTYFNTLFTKKRVELQLIVGGEEASDGKVYASLPFLNFIVNSEDFSEGPFDTDSARYKNVVKKRTYTSPSAPASNDTMVGSTDDSKMPWD